LELWKQTDDVEKTANALRFLSRLWWFDGNRQKAEFFNSKAIEILEYQPASKTKAMTFSNMSQLKMLADELDECLFWGNKAIEMAKELNDEEILADALNNVGSVQFTNQILSERGREQLQQSLDVALKNSFHEHVARAYTNFGTNSVLIKDYAFAKQKLDEGIHYCEERDLDLWASYMSAWKARLLLETGHWNEAAAIACNLLRNGAQSTVVRIICHVVVATIKIRRGEPDALPLLMEAEKKTFDTGELQRIIPVIVALLEYEWISGKKCIQAEALGRTIAMFRGTENIMDGIEFSFWLMKARNQGLEIPDVSIGAAIYSKLKSLTTAEIWEQLGCPYEHALALFEGDDDEKRKALTILSGLGANAVYEKMKLDMRSSGIKSIPRGIRKSTRANVAQLTSRELDVLALLKDGMQNKEIASTLFISAKTVDHHISSILVKLDVNSRVKAVHEAVRLEIIK
jgi:DNA-binding CsgD family transcriptional regulator